MTFKQYIAAEQKKRNDARYKLVGYLISPFITGWFLVWYNHVIVQWHVGYWQWVALSIPIMLCPGWMKVSVLGSVFAVSAIGQTAYWLGLISIPIIKP